MADEISRREVMRRIGAALAATGIPSAMSSAETAVPHPNQAKTKKSVNAKQPGTGKPNVLWITAEGVPISVLSCYGNRLVETPHVDRIAREGMRFSNGFCTNALCAPSRATLLTGKYSHLNGMISNPSDTTDEAARTTFDEKQETLPKILKRAGYQTGVVGKWHLPANPGRVGFDYFVYKNGAGGPYYEEEHYFRNRELGSDVTEETRIPGYITDNIVELSIDGMRKFTQPFFMAVQFFSVHRPFEPPHKYEHLYDGVRIPEPGTFYDDYSQRATAAAAARMRIADMPDYHAPVEMTERQRKQWNYQQYMKHFLSTLRAHDEAVGRLLDFLDESGLAENTIVIYTGDHGFFMGDHGWFDKRFMYEQAIRVPWIIRYPGKVKAGSVSDAWVVNIDNAPTVLDLVGVPVPEDMQGRSIAPLLAGDAPPDWAKSLYYHYYEFDKPHWVAPHYGIRTQRYKLIFYYTLNQWELFDWEKDPDEMENLWDWGGLQVHPGYERIAQDLVKELQQLREKYKDTSGLPVKLWPREEVD